MCLKVGPGIESKLEGEGSEVRPGQWSGGGGSRRALWKMGLNPKDLQETRKSL